MSLQPLLEQYIQSGHYLITDKNSLIITNPARYDAAIYTCIAKTALDSVEKSVQVGVDGKCKLPQNFYQIA